MMRLLLAFGVLAVPAAAQAQSSWDRNYGVANSTPRTYQSRPSYGRDTARRSVVYGARRTVLGEAARRATDAGRRGAGRVIGWTRGGPYGAAIGEFLRPRTAHAPTTDRPRPTEYDRGRVRYRWGR